MRLKKELTFLDIFCLASGAMISSGIFILPGLAFAKTGPSVIFSYVLAGLLALIGILSVIELSTAMPKAGGDYFFISRGLGPLAGIMAGFFSWLALSLKSAFAIFGLSELIYIFSGANLFLTGVAITLFFVTINALGMRYASRFQIFLVIILILALGIYVILGFPQVTPSYYQPFMTHGINGVIATAAFAFISFGGLMKIASMAEEVSNPKRNLPLGLLASVIIMTALYTLMLYITVGILPPGDLSSSLTPIADTAIRFLGSPGLITISILASLAFITTANAGIAAASRYPLALSRDHLLPKFIASINKNRKTPIVAIIFTGLLTIGALTLNLETLVKAGSTVILFSYLLSNISVIVFRHSKLRYYQPSFRTPLYPIPQIIGIIGFSYMIIDLGFVAIEVIIALILISIILHLFFGRKHQRYFALQCLIQRLIGKSGKSVLEKELKKILKERDVRSSRHFCLRCLKRK